MAKIRFVEPWAPEFTGTSWYVGKNGSDASVSGRGSMDKPFLTIQNAITLASAGDRIYVGRGTYTEALTIDKTLYVSAMVPESVLVTSATVAGATVLYNGTQTGGFWDGLNITNSNNAGTSFALAIANLGGMSGKYVFTKCRVLAGTAGATTAQSYVITGSAASAIQVEIDSPRSIGGNTIALAHANDVVTFRDVMWSDGPQDWFIVTGTAGNVYLKGCVLLGAGGTERFNFGAATACGVVCHIESSHINGLVYLNNAAGTGYVVMRDVGGIYAVTNNQRNNIIHYEDGDYLTIQMQSLDANAAGAVVMYTVPGGRQFFPERVTTTNKVVATGAAFTRAYNGSGAGTIVVAPVAGAFALGTTVETCIADVVPAAGTVGITITASTQAGDRVDATVKGRLM